MRRRNKRGWIRIVEAFIAVLLVAGVLLIVIQQGYIGGTDLSEQVYQDQLAVLREIELDDTFRRLILTAARPDDDPVDPEDDLPIKWEDFSNAQVGLSGVEAVIKTRIPDYLTCRGKICEMHEVCSLEDYIGQDVYAQAVAITAEKDEYAPRQLKLFCWTGANGQG